MIKDTESWNVDVKGQIYETSFEELAQWISEGAVLREDKVRRGNLRWLEAGRIPNLVTIFNARDLNIQPEPVITTSSPQESLSSPTSHFDPSTQILNSENFHDTAENYSLSAVDKDRNANFRPAQSEHHSVCINHPDSEPSFICESCSSRFCGVCPKKYGGTVRTCPLCGSMCQPFEEFSKPYVNNSQDHHVSDRGFGFDDLGAALGYPFRFKASFIFGSLMFAFFTLGQKASAIGGIVMVLAAIFCVMLSNMLTFGVLANTVDNFSQGKIGGNFMPGFDDFELWSDVIQPFFLSIAAYLVSFGFLAVVLIGGIWYLASSVNSIVPVQATTLLTPGDRANLSAGKSIPQIKQVTAGIAKENLWNDGEMPTEDEIVAKQRVINNDESEIAEIQSVIDQHRKGQVEAITGPTEEAQQAQMKEMLSGFIGLAFPFVILAFLAMVWGLFYFPAACLVAGYTRSFSATINPMNGLDTIKRFGIDYVKILFMSLGLVVFAGIVTGVVNALLSPFNIPMMGNLPAIFITSFFTFYVSIVFSVMLGFAMFRNNAKLK